MKVQAISRMGELGAYKTTGNTLLELIWTNGQAVLRYPIYVNLILHYISMDEVSMVPNLPHPL